MITRDKPCDHFERCDEVDSCATCGWPTHCHYVGERLSGSPEAPVALPLWWEQQVAMDIARTAPKIKEYGTKDLEAMGRLYAQIRGVEMRGDTAAVWGIMFYALGKITRALASLERGEMPSEDTLFDLSIYSMMARAYHARGKL